MKKIKVIDSEFGLIVSVKDFCRCLFENGVVTEKQSKTLFYNLFKEKAKQLSIACNLGYYSNSDLFVPVSMDEFYMSWACFRIVWKHVKKRDNTYLHKILMHIDSPEECRNNTEIFDLIKDITL